MMQAVGAEPQRFGTTAEEAAALQLQVAFSTWTPWLASFPETLVHQFPDI